LVQYHDRDRRVITIQVKQEAAQYLHQQYTNADGEPICQVCKTALPFKLDDGTDYFEKGCVPSSVKAAPLPKLLGALSEPRSHVPTREWLSGVYTRCIRWFD
jgi:hypothetical protein